jgi:voltage-gated potassium channel
VQEGSVVVEALKASRIKITVFIGFVTITSILMGALMYVVEHNYNPDIRNMPEGIYWAIMTLTTVGYGDVVPITIGGKILASTVMIMGYGVIAVPVGIVTSEIANHVLAQVKKMKVQCSRCGTDVHLDHSAYCHQCGETLV